MKILAIDTSTLVATVAVVEDQVLLGEISINHKKKHSEMLVPMIKELLSQLDLASTDIDVFAVSTGPGSFTGLRIGITTIKSMAYAVQKPTVGVTTLDGLAYNIQNFDGLICPIIDARNNQVYSSIYKSKPDGSYDNLTGYMAKDILEVIKMAKDLESNVVFIGDGVWLYKDIIRKELAEKAHFVPGNLIVPRASSIAHIAYIKALRDEISDGFELVPFYLRKSQAERMLELKQQQEEQIKSMSEDGGVK